MHLDETDPRVVVSYFARFVWVLKSRMAWVGARMTSLPRLCWLLAQSEHRTVPN